MVMMGRRCWACSSPALHRHGLLLWCRSRPHQRCSQMHGYDVAGLHGGLPLVSVELVSLSSPSNPVALAKSRMFSRQGTPAMITSLVGSMPLSLSAAAIAWVYGGHHQVSSALAGDGRCEVADVASAGFLALCLADVGDDEVFGSWAIVEGHVEPRGIDPGQP